MDFEQYLPDGARSKMLRERITQLAGEGLAIEIALTEADARGDVDEVAQLTSNIAMIKASIEAAESQL